MFTGTALEFSKSEQIPYSMAGHVLQFLELKGFAHRKDKQKPVGGKGKPSIVWEVQTPVKILTDYDIPVVVPKV